MSKAPRTAYLTPIKVGKRNYYDAEHWRWKADVCWRGELLCAMHISCTERHDLKRDTIHCAMKKLKMLGIRPDCICLHKTETVKDADWVGTECMYCGNPSGNGGHNE